MVERKWTRAAILALVGLLVSIPGLGLGQEPVERTWGFGWDDGLTLRYWLDGKWEFALSAGPDDYLVKDEERTWQAGDPQDLQGMVEVPRDVRDEHGWVRLQAGRLVAKRDNIALVGFTGLTYEWIDHQDRHLQLDSMQGDYDTYELTRFTHHWVWALGLRPSWQATSFMTIETSFGLQFTWDSWDQSIHETWAGVEGESLIITSGHGRSFQDFGWEGMASLQFMFWF